MSNLLVLSDDVVTGYQDGYIFSPQKCVSVLNVCVTSFGPTSGPQVNITSMGKPRAAG